MTTSTMEQPTRHNPENRHGAGSGLNFFRLLRSEWIKLSTLRSTVILLLVTLVVMVGLATLMAWGLQMSQGLMNDSPAAAQQAGPPPAGPPTEGGVTTEGGASLADAALMVPSAGVIFGQLTLATLAVMLIASEWSTGMIRSTLVAVPKRLPVLLAKNVVVAVVAFILGVAAAAISYFVAQPILGVQDMDFSLSADGVIAGILNTGTYLALIAVISMGIGTLLRNTAGGVVTAIGVFFVLPMIVVQILSTLWDWVPDAARFLPTNAGQQMLSITTADGDLTQWQGGLVMAGWAVLLLVVSLIVAKRRDV